jgi:hypothetical protein
MENRGGEPVKRDNPQTLRATPDNRTAQTFVASIRIARED